MPGMIHQECSPASISTPCFSTPSHSSLSSSLSPSSLSSPLQSFSSLTLSPLPNGISPQHLMMLMGSHAPPSSSSSSPSSNPLREQPHSWVQELRSEERGLLIIQLLLKCASSVAGNQLEYTNHLLEQLSVLASITGDPMQRVATHFMEGLAARTTKSWPGLYKALNCAHLPSPCELLTARQIFFNLCPYLKFAFTIVNHAILGAMENEKVMHIIDLGASEVIQWVAMLQMLSARVGGPPHLRITIINQRKDVLDQMGQRLCKEAENLDIPFQFHPVVAKLEDVDAEMLKVKSGEAVAVSAILQLHCLLVQEEISECTTNRGVRGSTFYPGMPRNITDGDRTLRELFEKEGNDMNAYIRGFGPREGKCSGVEAGTVADRVLRMLRGLMPKVMVVMEAEVSMNGGDFIERFVEALHYYSAVFDSLESSLPTKFGAERLAMERHMFGRSIHNIVACEGSERVERQERLPSWMKRAQLAGFSQRPFPYGAALHAKGFLSSYPSDGYRLLEDHGCLTVCWQDTPLFSASSWLA